MKKNNPKKPKIDKNQPSVMDYFLADETNQKVGDIFNQRIELEENRRKEEFKKK